MQYCTYHCTNCGRHFASCEAFDAHLHHEYGEHADWFGVIDVWCDPPTEHKLEAVVGTCRLTGGDPADGVEIWRKPRPDLPRWGESRKRAPVEPREQVCA